MRFNDETIKSVGELIENLRNHLGSFEGPAWFRGQAVSTWKLEPKLLRSTPVPSESHLLNRFKQNATYLLQRPPGTDFEWMFLMQHYHLKTRLLDWTESPLVGLYFAVYGQDTEEGALWILLPTLLNQKSHYKPDFEQEVPSFEDEYLKNYSPESIAGEHKSKLNPMAAIAPRNSPRMQAQLGVFTISHRENIYIEEVGDSGSARDHIWRYLIPANSKANILNELKLLGYNRFSLFPELESLGETIFGA
jgi:hypothetical protein